MIDLKKTEAIYFVGIGGIGMSAIALYFIKGGFTVGGYDRSESKITVSLKEAGCSISYDDEVSSIPEKFRDNSSGMRDTKF